CKSALSRYTQWDFISLVNKHRIAYHERDLGKLFCDDSASDILDMLLQECKKVNVNIRLNCQINKVNKSEHFIVESQLGDFHASSLVIACGGLSIPKMCASPLGYQLAEQFGHKILPTTAGLVPFTLQPKDKKQFETLSGISVESNVSNQDVIFNNENILFTHRGLSGPAILQISSYWKPGETVTINLLPNQDVAQLIKSRQKKQPNLKLKTVLAEILPKRLVSALLGESIVEKTLQELSQDRINEIAKQCQQWQIKPNGTEGYRTAEVTLGGVDCNELSSKSMESSKTSNLFFIGEVVDVTGWLGGYNFQWAWSSGWCAGQIV
ncbi:MAG: aminoacetone oxidase family FAD-binding enzyme, partial [Methylococcaceae bacterium]